MRRPHIALLFAALLFAAPAHAQDWRLDTGLTFSRFEQQVKTEVGGARGERLVEQTEFGLNVFGTYNVWSFIHLGLYAQYDAGLRENGRFAGFTSDNEAIVDPAFGGAYHELWLGPLVRFQWRTLFLEVGYGALGLRWDEARTDLPDESGDTGSALKTHPGIAWLIGLGAGVPVTESLEVVLRVEYRVRYYNRRGDALVNEIAHGTQNITPFFGVAWNL